MGAVPENLKTWGNWPGPLENIECSICYKKFGSQNFRSDVLDVMSPLAPLALGL